MIHSRLSFLHKPALVSLIVLCGVAFAADRNSGTSPDVAPLATTVQVLPEAPHEYLDRHNKVSILVFASLLAADGISTQRNLANHAQELNPFARPLVNRGWAGQLGASALGCGSALGLSYMFHRTGHHKLERFALHLAIGAEAAVVTNNLARAH
ncbi:MAG TPA: hypothetical protein VFI95_04995 [Terriglobales bacterium]|nr:hypothetical protein [Terriglobales bacterium]